MICFPAFLRFLTVSLFVVASTCAAYPALATGVSTDTTSSVVAATPTASSTANISATAISQLAYVLAWRSAQEATQHTDAVRLTGVLATRLGLPADNAANKVVERFLDNELAANPGRFNASDAPGKVLDQLLREDVDGFQRTLSPLLSEECYERYLSLLDSLRIAVR